MEASPCSAGSLEDAGLCQLSAHIFRIPHRHRGGCVRLDAPDIVAVGLGEQATKLRQLFHETSANGRRGPPPAHRRVCAALRATSRSACGLGTETVLCRRCSALTAPSVVVERDHLAKQRVLREAQQIGVRGLLQVCILLPEASHIVDYLTRIVPHHELRHHDQRRWCWDIHPVPHTWQNDPWTSKLGLLSGRSSAIVLIGTPEALLMQAITGPEPAWQLTLPAHGRNQSEMSMRSEELPQLECKIIVRPFGERALLV